MSSLAVTKIFKVGQLTSSVRAFSTSMSVLAEKTPAPSKAKSSSAAPTSQPDGTTYESKDYYDYNLYSHYDIEGEMVKYRLPQPSALPKNNFTYSKLPPKK